MNDSRLSFALATRKYIDMKTKSLASSETALPNP